MQKETGSRCEWLDVAKGYAILLVVIGHMIQFYLYPESYQTDLVYGLIYSFHMPFFFILSGFAASFSIVKEINVNNVDKKLKRLIIPFVSWALVNYVLSSINGSFTLSRLLAYVYYPAGGGLWYLWALFFIYVIHASIIRLNSNNLYYRFLVLLLTYIILLRLSALLDGHFGMYEISRYFIFYALGFEINTITRILKPHCMLIYTCMFAGLFTYNWGGHFGISLWMDKQILSLLGSLAFICFTIFSVEKMSYNAVKQFVRLGQSTLGIYASHFYFIFIISKIINGSIIGFFPLLILVILISYILTKILKSIRICSYLFLGE